MDTYEQFTMFNIIRQLTKAQCGQGFKQKYPAKKQGMYVSRSRLELPTFGL